MVDWEITGVGGNLADGYRADLSPNAPGLVGGTVVIRPYQAGVLGFVPEMAGRSFSAPGTCTTPNAVRNYVVAKAHAATPVPQWVRQALPAVSRTKHPNLPTGADWDENVRERHQLLAAQFARLGGRIWHLNGSWFVSPPDREFSLIVRFSNSTVAQGAQPWTEPADVGWIGLHRGWSFMRLPETHSPDWSGPLFSDDESYTLALADPLWFTESLAAACHW
jgi:hypothetical protein